MVGFGCGHRHAGDFRLRIRSCGEEFFSGFIGSGAMRFILTYGPEMANSAYGLMLVSIDDYRSIPGMIDQMRERLESEYPEVTFKLNAFKFGPGGNSVEVRFSGRDSDVLRSLAEQASDIFEAHPNAETNQNNWGNRVKTMQIELAEARSRKLGVSRLDVANSLVVNFSGMVAGLYRDGDELLPIILRLPKEQRLGIENLDNTQILNSATGKFVPLQQVSDGVKLHWSDPVIHRLDRTRTVTVSCKHITGTSDALLQDLKTKIEAIELPSGYKMAWGGEYENSRHANEKLMQKVPHTFVIMFFIIVILFNTMRHAYIIFAGLPLAIIGVTAGLLISGQPFGFMATLGFLSLAGMLMKNEIVLLDQINLELKVGKTPFPAVIDAAASRVRPVSMAAFTTVLGMVPHLWDPFFVSIAVTIMSGLTFATILTLIVIPVFYSIMFRVKNED